jgi:predicted kinase
MCRGVFNQESSVGVAKAARAMVAVRLISGLPAALDCTHNGYTAREDALALAKEHGARCIALLCRVPYQEVQRRNMARADHLQVPEFVVAQMNAQVKTLRVPGLLADGFDAVYTFNKTTSDLVINFTD